MLKSTALKLGYCNHCAAFNGKMKIQRCGMLGDPSNDCQLPEDVMKRWKSEHGLEGEAKRFVKPEFGDKELMKKPRAKKRRRL